MTKNFLELKNINKYFPKNNLKVLKNLNFNFKKGKIYSIVGPSGSGKSTLLSIISFIDQPSSGKIIFEEKKINYSDIKKNDELRSNKIGIVYQDKNLLSDFTALENIFLASLTKSDDEKFSIKQADKLLKKFNLLSRKNHYPSQLSGGEMQRVAIARAIINKPNLILADEPTGNLDEKNSKDIFKTLLKLKNKDTTIIYATHNLYFAKMADYKLKIRDGRLKAYNA